MRHIRTLYASVMWVITFLASMLMEKLLVVIALIAIALIGAAHQAQGQNNSVGINQFEQTGQAGVRVGPSGLPLPRFVSLKANRVNVRQGPSDTHDVNWIFVRGGLPVEVIEEFDNWRQIRDAGGNEGWVFHSLLSGRRTALVAPWSRQPEPIPLYRERNRGAKLNARLAPGVVVDITECDGNWCRSIAADGEGDRYRGFIEQEQLWGVYPDEVFED